MRKVTDWLYKNKDIILKTLIILSFIMFVLMYQWLGIREDDDFYMHGWGTGEYISSLQDIAYFLKMHYLFWGGRIVSHGILQLMFYIGKPYSAILNAAAFFGLAYALSKAVCGKNKLVPYAMTLCLLFYLNPYREEIIMWYTGCANYIWTTMIIFFAALPYINALRTGDYKVSSKYWFMLPLYFLAGWTNENMAPTMIMFMLYVIFDEYRNTKKIDLFKIISTLLAFAGCCFLMLAPGNYVRSGSVWNGIFSTVAFRVNNQIYAWTNWLLIPMLLFVMFRYLNYRNNNSGNRKFTYPLIAWYVLSILILIGSPIFPQRATSGSFCILLILLVDEIKRLFFKDKDGEYFASVLSVLLLFALTVAMFGIAVTELSYLI